MPDGQERETLSRIRAMRDGGFSLRNIAAQLNAQAVPARGAKCISAASSSRLGPRDGERYTDIASASRGSSEACQACRGRDDEGGARSQLLRRRMQCGRWGALRGSLVVQATGIVIRPVGRHQGVPIERTVCVIRGFLSLFLYHFLTRGSRRPSPDTSPLNTAYSPSPCAPLW